MADSIPKIPVSMGYNQLKNEAMKDLMDILKGRENIPLKPSVQVKSNTNKNAVEQGNDIKGTVQNSYKTSPPNKDVLVQTLKQIVEGYQINDKDSLFLKADNISQELQEQHNSTIKFKGEFFNFLRNVLQQHSGNKSIENAVVDVLRGYITLTNKANLQNNLSEHLNQLVQMLTQKGQATSPQVNEIKQLIQQNQSVNELKNLTPILKEISIQNTKDPEIMSVISKATEIIEKIQALEKKDVSLHKSLKRLLDQLPDSKLAERFKNFNQKFEQLFFIQENHGVERTEAQPKTVVDKIVAMFIKAGSIAELKTDTIESNLAKALVMNKTDEQNKSEPLKQLINHQISKENTIETTESKNILEKILLKLTDKSKQLPDNEGINRLAETFLKGMTATQSSKQPLLHFLLPIRFEDTQAMGEIWIDPNDQEEGENNQNGKSSTHMFLTLNIEQVGNFELDILLDGKTVDIQLYCPSSVIEQFSDSERQIPQIVEKTGLHLNRFEITLAKKNRQLEEIFPNSFKKRMGVNVKA